MGVAGWADELEQLHVPEAERRQHVMNVFGNNEDVRHSLQSASQYSVTKAPSAQDVLQRLGEGEGEGQEGKEKSSDGGVKGVLKRLERKLIRSPRSDSHEFASLDNSDDIETLT